MSSANDGESTGVLPPPPPPPPDPPDPLDGAVAFVHAVRASRQMTIRDTRMQGSELVQIDGWVVGNAQKMR